MVFQTIKRLLGLERSTGREERTETEVTVEQEPTPAAETEAAVKGTDASASTETLVDEEAAREEPAARAEPAEAAGPESADETTDVESVEPEAEPAPEGGGGDDAVTEIKGVGPAYGDRLAEAGIDTVGELAGADAAEVAEQISVGENRVQRWIDRANEYE